MENLAGTGTLVDYAIGKASILNQFFSSVFTEEDLISLPVVGARCEGTIVSDGGEFS